MLQKNLITTDAIVSPTVRLPPVKRILCYICFMCRGTQVVYAWICPMIKYLIQYNDIRGEPKHILENKSTTCPITGKLSITRNKEDIYGKYFKTKRKGNISQGSRLQETL